MQAEAEDCTSEQLGRKDKKGSLALNWVAQLWCTRHRVPVSGD